MKIWLDDIRDTPQEFTHTARTVLELIRLIQDNPEPIEVISFDHDLGLGATGYDAIKFLAHHFLDRWPKEVRVHSANPVGAQAIRQYDEFVRRRLLLTAGGS